MHYIDVSSALRSDSPAYPNDPSIDLIPWSRRAGGSDFNVTAVRLGSHSGTHVDAPAHCIDGGATVDALSLDVLCGPAFVLDLTRGDRSRPSSPDASAFADIPKGCERLLLRTHGREPWQAAAYPAVGLSTSAAGSLVERGIRLMGIDQLSIAAPDVELPVHRLLLEADVVIVEGLELAHVPQGEYELLCLPLKLADGDGAPARVVLRAR